MQNKNRNKENLVELTKILSVNSIEYKLRDTVLRNGHNFLSESIPIDVFIQDVINPIQNINTDQFESICDFLIENQTTSNYQPSDVDDEENELPYGQQLIWCEDQLYRFLFDIIMNRVPTPLETFILGESKPLIIWHESPLGLQAFKEINN